MEKINVGIRSVGSYVPAGIRDSFYISEKSGIPEQVIREKFGIKQVHKAGPEERVADMGAKAARIYPTVVFCGTDLARMAERGEYTPLCLELRDRYEYIMEDEFQDSSYIQDAIFNRISKEGQSNLFVVGDIKQSIYSFRKASPEIFKAKRQLGIDDPDQAETIFLKHNFRSEESVLNGVNYLFSRLMSEKCGGVDYDEN